MTQDTIEIMNAFAETLEEFFNPKSKRYFWVLLVGPFGDDNRKANYISNGERSDIIEFLRETADRLEKKQDQS